MKYHALFVIFEKQQNLKFSSAANYRWRFKGKYGCIVWMEKGVDTDQLASSEALWICMIHNSKCSTANVYRG